MKLFLTLQPPFEWTVVDGKSEVTDGGEVTALAQINVPSEVTEVIGIVPGEEITIRRVMLPGRRRSNAVAAMPYALEESLTEEVEALHFTLLEWKPGQPATVAIVARSVLQTWLNECQDAGIEIDRILPGYLLLPLHTTDSTTVSPVSGSNDIYVRSGSITGFAIDRDYFRYWLEEEQPDGDSIAVSDGALAREINEVLTSSASGASTAERVLKVRFWDIGQRPALWLRAGSASNLPERFALLHGDFVPAHRSRNYRPLKVALVCGLLGLTLYFGSMYRETVNLEQEQQALRQEMRSLFQRSFPGQPWLGRPQTQVNALLAEIDGDRDEHGFSSLLEAVSSVALQHQATIEELNYRDRSMTVLCIVNSLSELDDIRGALSALPGMSAELLSSGSTEDLVTGRFRLRAG